MEIRWGKQNKKAPAAIPSGVAEDAAQTIARERRFNSAIDEIISNHAKEGGFANLEGKGKPLDLSGERNADDYLVRVMKNANVLPDWLELQHEIRDAILAVIDLLRRDPHRNVEKDLEKINAKIKQYNQKCPTPLLHKPLITDENIHTQIAKWE